MKLHPFVALALVALLSPLARGQASPFMGMDAAVSAVGYPSWTKEGVRLTFRMSVSTPNATGSGLVSASSGLSQIDIVSVAGGKVAYNLNSLMEVQASPFGGRSGWYQHAQLGFVAPAGYGEYWVHPTVLAQAAQLHEQGKTWQVTRGTQRLAGESRKTIGFVMTDDKSRHSYIFDSDQGLLLTLASSTRTGATASFLPTMTIELLGIRTRALPWLQGRPPAWALDAKRFVYKGSMTTTFSGGYQNQSEVEVKFDVDEAGPNYISGFLSSSFGGVKNDSMPKRLSGASATGGVWIPPLELRALAERYKGRNITLDKDSSTRAELMLTFAGRSPYGRNIVTLSETTGVSTHVWDYEVETGALLHMTSHYDPTSSMVETWLTELE